MLCDELKAYTYDDMLDGNADVDIEYYPKSEVGAAIEELKAENRRLKRALYKACANWADCKACILEYVGVKLHAKKWERMFNKCRAKAEEYK